MTSRSALIRSGLQLLIQDQKRVTTAFKRWKENGVSSTASVAPIIASVYRRLQRDLDRLFVLAESYNIEDEPEGRDGDSAPACNDSDDQASAPKSRLPAVTPSVAEVLQEGYESLEQLSTRYASVYCMATAVMEPSVANVAQSNLEGTRNLASELMGALALVRVEEVTSAHPSLVVNVSAGPRARDLLQNLWAPKPPAQDAAAEVAEVVAEHA